MRELLVRYLMGELDGPEQRQLEARLRTSPELRSELAYLRSCFKAANEGCEDAVEPPRGLAERTTGLVNEFSGESAGGCHSLANFGARRVAAFAADLDPPACGPRWNFADFVVAAGVCLAVSMLVLPALSDSQEAGLRRLCQNNLRELGQTHALYAERNDHLLAPIEPYENAGIFVLHFVNEGYVSQQQMAQLRRCPGTLRLAENGRREFTFECPSFPQLRTMTPGELERIRKEMSPDYRVLIGFVVDGKYYHRRDQRNPRVPVMADSPGSLKRGQIDGNHYGACNVLYADGRVATQRKPTVWGKNDDLFSNSEGLLAPGCGEGDQVLVPGETILLTTPTTKP